MGLFKNWKKQEVQEKAAFSPVSGELVPLETVSDAVFAEKSLGDGVAVIPTDGSLYAAAVDPKEGVLYAPADGTIVALFPTGHALGIKTRDGVELLIHIGIDTVALNGKGFTVHVKQDDTVKKGQLLVNFDIEVLKGAGYDTVTMMLVSNGEQFGEVHKAPPGTVTAGEKILWL